MAVNKITVVLTHAVLEWTLILLLLLNSLFSYMIVKFADYFRLKPPCFWCSQLDPTMFKSGEEEDKEEKKKKNLQRDLLCESHSREVSKLGFCETHNKLAESKALCRDCSGLPDFGLFPWMKICSCCGVSLEGAKFGSPYIVIKSSWNALIKEEDQENSEKIWTDFEGFRPENEDQEENGVLEETPERVMKDEEAEFSLGNPQKHLEFFIDCSGRDLVPIELVDFTASEYEHRHEFKDETETDYLKEPKFAVFESMEIQEDEKSLVFYAKDHSPENNEVQFLGSEEHQDEEEETENNEVQILGLETHNEQEDLSENNQVQILGSEEHHDQEDSSESNKVQFLGPEEHQEQEGSSESNEVQILGSEEHQEQEDSSESNEVQILGLEEHQEQEDSSESNKVQIFGSEEHQEQEDSSQNNEVQILGSEEHQEQQDSYTDDAPAQPVCEEHSQMQVNDSEPEVSIGTEIPDLDFADSLDIQDHGCCKQDQDQPIELRALSVVDSNENEGSLDGSVMSEMDGSDPISTIERLKSALKSERRALHALYTELEEERSASAVAANQTMAMINRLQEEKAAVQMEALQYQRMMDEQSEYDQEALQLLNELMVKRERERQEVERELEVYKKRVSEYESKERDKKSSRSFFSSVSCSNSEASGDGLSIDLNQEVKEEEIFYNTPPAEVVNLEESLGDFEDERVAILEQLKALEEKLVTIDSEEEEEEMDVLNGHSNGNGYHIKEKNDPKVLSSMGKSLLPLFDAISDENGDYDYDLNNKRVALEEELDCLHERLQALEADREFLKNCLSSLKKGDKGMDLLQEILQHLRDLRSVDLRTRNGCLV